LRAGAHPEDSWDSRGPIPWPEEGTSRRRAGVACVTAGKFVANITAFSRSHAQRAASHAGAGRSARWPGRMAAPGGHHTGCAREGRVRQDRVVRCSPAVRIPMA